MAYTKESFLPRLSINTNNHVSSLDVLGNISVGTFGGVSAAPTNGMLVSGNVGIGTTTIGGVLSVSLSQVIDSSPTPAQQISINPTYTVTGEASTSIDCVRSIPNFDCTNGNLTGTYSGIVGMPLARGTNTITSMIAVNGNVRMGGSTPVTVTNGSAFVASSWNLVANSTVTNYRGFQTGNVNWTDATNLITNYYHFFGTNVTGAGVITNQYGLFLQNMTKGATLNYAIYSEGGQSYHVGNLGLNTAVPLNKLDVNGAVAVGSFAGVNTAPASGMLVSGDVAFGVSSVFGSARLTVSKTRAFSPSTGEGLVTFMDTTALAADNGASLLFRGIYTGTGTSAMYGAIKAGKTNATDGNLDAYLALYSRSNALGGQEVMRLTAEARVGIGTTNPSGLLQVSNATAAFFHLQDTGATTNEQLMQLRTDNNVTKFRSLNDAGSAVIQDNILSMIHSTGNISVGAATNTYRFEVTGGEIACRTLGNGFRVAEGSNARMGTATLDGGTPATVVVNTTAVTANSRIFITGQTLGTIAVGAGYSVSARTAGTSFTITSSAATDTSSVAWIIFEPS